MCWDGEKESKGKEGWTLIQEKDMRYVILRNKQLKNKRLTLLLKSTHQDNDCTSKALVIIVYLKLSL